MRYQPSEQLLIELEEGITATVEVTFHRRGGVWERCDIQCIAVEVACGDLTLPVDLDDDSFSPTPGERIEAKLEDDRRLLELIDGAIERNAAEWDQDEIETEAEHRWEVANGY